MKESLYIILFFQLCEALVVIAPVADRRRTALELALG